MRKPISIRPLTEDEQHTLQEGLRSSNAFVLRRCQILLASARGQTARVIGEALGCDDQTVRNVIREFERDGLDACLTRGSTRPHTIHAKVAAVAAEQLRALLHQSPRTFGKPTSVWTLELASEVACTEGITAEQVSDETIRQALLRLGVGWNEPDRARVGARQARRHRAGAQARQPRTSAAALRPPPLRTPSAASTTARLILH